MKLEFTSAQKNSLLIWRDELRKTTKKQGKDCLHPTEDSFCCLGIYVDLRDPNRWRFTNNEWIYEEDSDDYSMIYSITTLPAFMKKELGLDKEVDIIPKNNPYANYEIEDIFAYLNDSSNWTFEQISNEIDYLVEYGEFSQEALDSL